MPLRSFINSVSVIIAAISPCQSSFRDVGAPVIPSEGFFCSIQFKSLKYEFRGVTAEECEEFCKNPPVWDGESLGSCSSAPEDHLEVFHPGGPMKIFKRHFGKNPPVPPSTILNHAQAYLYHYSACANIRSILSSAELLPEGGSKNLNNYSSQRIPGVYFQLQNENVRPTVPGSPVGESAFIFDLKELDNRSDYHFSDGWRFGWYTGQDSRLPADPFIIEYMKFALVSNPRNEVVFQNPVSLNHLKKLRFQKSTFIKSEDKTYVAVLHPGCNDALEWLKHTYPDSSTRETDSYIEITLNTKLQPQN